jgi:hypothetical protein
LEGKNYIFRSYFLVHFFLNSMMMLFVHLKINSTLNGVSKHPIMFSNVDLPLLVLSFVNIFYLRFLLITMGVINIMNKINKYATLLKNGLKKAIPIAINEDIGKAKFL